MNCVFEMGSVVPRGELYASYVDDLRHRYGALSGSVQTFTNIMRFILQCLSYIDLRYVLKIRWRIKQAQDCCLSEIYFSN